MKARIPIDCLARIREPESRFRKPSEPYYEHELLLKRYVLEGDVHPFEAMQRDLSSFRTSEVPLLYMQRQYLTTAATLASRYAISAGVDVDLSFTILNELLEDIVRAQTSRETAALYPRVFLRFAQEVARVQEDEPSDALCLRVHRYIWGHLNEKTSASAIAEALGYNASYLSTHFQKTMGLSITAYIHKCKRMIR